MIVLGDIAVPSKELVGVLEDTFRSNRNIFSDHKVVFNLEGLISDHHSLNTDTPILFNHPELLSMLSRECKGAVAALANNHTLDIPEQFSESEAALQDTNVPFTGAARSSEKATEPVFFSDSGNDVYLFNYCWDFLLYHQKNPSAGLHVAEMNAKKILQQISQHRKTNPDSSVIIYFHWSLELETLPFPMYRGFSKALIDVGADLVVGCHSHCIQGGEEYNGGYIVYGLGNFYIPWGVYTGGNLRFSEISKMTLALEWSPKTKEAICHWFEYREEDRSLLFRGSENFSGSSRLKKYTPYSDLNRREYEEYFKRNRRKSFMIPIYKDHNRALENKFLTFLLKIRAKTARKLAEMNLIKWQN